jgi:hypothetical protein
VIEERGALDVYVRSFTGWATGGTYLAQVMMVHWAVQHHPVSIRSPSPLSRAHTPLRVC